MRAPRLKAYLALIVVAAAVIGLGHVGSLDFLAEWVPSWRSARVWTDPALDRLAAPEPKELWLAREAGHEDLVRYGAFEAVLDFLRRRVG